MPAWVHRIETMVPEFSFSQEQACLKMQEWFRDDRVKRILRVLYRQSGIETRHSVITKFDGAGGEGFLRAAAEGLPQGPGTAARNDIFARESKALSVALAGKILERCPGIEPNDITHVVTVSCTGFYNPGPDYYVVRDLGLSHSVQRYHLGFMGCYAAFPALRMAAQFCAAQPRAVVLVMCLELCTLHVQISDKEDSLLANSLFADGAGAAIVSARNPEPGQNVYRVGDFHSAIVSGSEGDMAWRIGDHGFDIALSSYVPKIIGANIRSCIEPSLAASGLSSAGVETWAVHPGGRAIIDQVQAALALRPEQVGASRQVLREYGNMSSASILFVLQKILEGPSTRDRESVCAMAFGPGLTVEMVLLEAQREVANTAVGATY